MRRADSIGSYHSAVLRGQVCGAVPEILGRLKRENREDLYIGGGREPARADIIVSAESPLVYVLPQAIKSLRNTLHSQASYRCCTCIYIRKANHEKIGTEQKLLGKSIGKIKTEIIQQMK